jgi:hypothetical protein
LRQSEKIYEKEFRQKIRKIEHFKSKGIFGEAPQHSKHSKASKKIIISDWILQQLCDLQPYRAE